MAKTQIRRLKAERFWRWLAVEVYGRTDLKEYYAKHPIQKDRRGWKLRPRERRQLLRPSRIAALIKRLDAEVEHESSQDSGRL